MEVIGGTISTNAQDMFDHDKRQKSAISGNLLHLAQLSLVDVFLFLQGFLCNFGRKSLQIWRKLPDFRAKNNA